MQNSGKFWTINHRVITKNFWESPQLLHLEPVPNCGPIQWCFCWTSVSDERTLLFGGIAMPSIKISWYFPTRLCYHATHCSYKAEPAAQVNFVADNKERPRAPKFLGSLLLLKRSNTTTWSVQWENNKTMRWIACILIILRFGVLDGRPMESFNRIQEQNTNIDQVKDNLFFISIVLIINFSG